MKKCFKCKETKPLSEFYPHGQMGDKHLNKCKQCTKKDVTQNRFKNIEKIRAYDRKRARLPHRIKNKIERNKIYKEKFPLHFKARGAVTRAVRSGKLKRPDICEICKKEARIYGHHDDYTKPLDVKWLCQPCHSSLHQDLRREALDEYNKEVGDK